MIVVVEGISASGKTWWCAQHAGGHVIAETGRVRGAPDSVADPAGAAVYWADRNVERWQAALLLEGSAGPVVCDTDPLKLHYAWCSWQLGLATEAAWRLALGATRAAIAAHRIGFADLYLVADIPPEIARMRVAQDHGRRRRNFAVHARMQPALLVWYSVIGAALPGRVRFGLPESMPSLQVTDPRYDLQVFDRIVAALPRP